MPIASRAIPHPLALLLTAALAAGCASTSTRPPGSSWQADLGAPSQVTPDEALAIARRLSTHPWRPFATNILHGKDRSGIAVETPDAGLRSPPERPGWWLPGEVNTGLPYKWGGFDDPASFDSAVATGLAAGDVSTPEKRRLDNAGVSKQAAGVDCSGFVSRCLKLPAIYDTARLPSICTLLADPQDLHPGDLLNISRGHVILCAGWAGAGRRSIYYYETGGPPQYWKPGLKQAPLDALLALGYQPLRYRGMTPGQRTEGKEVLTRALRTTAAVVTHPVVGEP